MNDFINKLDLILETSNIEKAQIFIEKSIEDAIKEKDTSSLVTILNEAIGFFRDITNLEYCLKYSDALYNLINNLNIEDPLYKAIVYINLANSYRACLLFDKSLILSQKAEVLFLDNNLTSDLHYASLLNNKALTYQNINNHKEAIKLLKEALKYSLDIYKQATTYVNLAISYMKLNDLENSFIYLTKANDIFSKDDDPDFHIMGYLVAYGQYNFLVKDYQIAKETYELALAYISKFVGFSKYYNETLEEYYNVLDILNINRFQPLLKIKKDYYNKYGKSVLKKYKNIVVGSFGFGSENYNLDDFVSMDHDYEPGFIILVNDNDTNLFNELSMFYNNLPKIFNRFYIKNKSKRHGVFYITDFLNSIGYYSNNEVSLSRVLNGEIYLDESQMLIKIRNELKDQFNDNFYRLLSKEVLEFGQIVQYNIPRCLKRGDLSSSLYLKSQLPSKLVKICHILNKKYLIHDKYQLKVLEKYNYKDIFINYINVILNNEDDFLNKSNIFINDLLNILKDNLLILNVTSLYLMDYEKEFKENIDIYDIKKELISEIISLEYKMFDSTNNIGGKAECQKNYGVFILMRKSQFYAWDLDLLNSYLLDLKIAFDKVQNIVTYKYAFMESSTDPNHYNQIMKFLPQISKHRLDIINEVVKIQLDNLLDFYSHYPNLKKSMRSIYTSEDLIDNTSYETYLRGELCSYSETTCLKYAKYLIKLNSLNQNIVYNTLFYNAFFQDLTINDL